MPTAPHLLRAVQRLGRLALRPALRLGVFCLLSQLATWTLLSTAAQLNEFRDAHVLSQYERVAVDTVLHFGQVPLWDPYYCGGMYLLGTPQSRFASPTFLLSLLFGESRGEAVIAFAMIVIGLEGTYRYARSHGARAFAALISAPIFALSGVFAIAPALGWVNFFGFELIPWAALGVRLACRGEPRGIVIASVALAWCIGFGGTYAAPLAALWLLFEALGAALTLVRRRGGGARARWLTALGMGTATAIFAVGLSSFRLLPVLDSLKAAPRLIGGTPGSSFTTLLRMLALPFVANAADHKDDGTYFIGLLSLPAVLFGLSRLRSIPLLVATYAMGWLAAGYGMKPSLFALLRELPFYSTLRYPERYLVFVALAAAVLAARGISTLMAWRRARRPWLRTAAAFALGIASVALVVNLIPQIKVHRDAAGTREMSAALPDLADRDFHQARGTRWALAHYEPMNRGSLSCWEAYPVPQSPRLRGDLREEEYLDDTTAGSVHRSQWSPNRIELEAQLTRPAKLLVNQNWHAGWRSDVGEVVSSHGLLAVALPAGEHHVSLKFRPRSALGGGLVSGASLLGLAWIARKRRPQAAVILSAFVPIVALSLAMLLFRDAETEAEPMLDNGEPLITDTLSESAVRLDARLAGGVTLEATVLSNPTPAPGETITLELDWKRAAQIQKGLGVFMHILPDSGDKMTGDHALLSNVLDLEKAPPGRTLRDIVRIHIPQDSAGKHWKIWIGLWGLRGDGKRVPVIDPGAATVDDDRILAGELDVVK